MWQIHVFGEGNTRTIAVFLLKYLRKLGFENANYDLFAEHSWYFRNALVRANYENLSNGVNKNQPYLLLFLSNLALEKKHTLKNRELHIDFELTKNDPVNDPVNLQMNSLEVFVLSLLRQNKNKTLMVSGN